VNCRCYFTIEARWESEIEPIRVPDSFIVPGFLCELTLSRFYPILEPLWRKMRDMVFTILPAPKKRGLGGRKQSVPTPAAKKDAEEAACEVGSVLAETLLRLRRMVHCFDHMNLTFH